MKEIMIAGEKGRLGIYGSCLHLAWTRGAHVEAGDAAASIEAMHALSGGRRLPLLVTIAGVTMSAGARGSYDHAKAVSAVALLGSSVVDTVVAAALGRHGFCPHAYFTSRKKALAWLGGFQIPMVSAEEEPGVGNA